MIKFNSLKAKIITLLTCISLSIAFILLYLFISFYKKDKIAYIFENNAALLDTVGEQFRREVEFSSEVIKVHLENSKINQKLALSSETQLRDDYFLDSIVVYQKTPQLQLIDKLSKAGKEISEAEVKQFIAQQPPGEEQLVNVDNVMVTVTSSFSKDQQSWFLVYRFRSTTLSDYFKNVENVNTALLNKTAGIGKYEYPQLDNLNPEKVNQELIKKIIPGLTQTTSTKTANLQNKRFLLSSTKLYQSDWYLATFVSEEKVLANLNNLMIKSILFFILISSLVILISYLSSDYITHRLKRLTQSAQRIAGGKFDEKIQDTGNDEITTLTTGFNQMSTEISRLLHETASNARMESELKTAQAVQSTLLPQSDYESDFIQIKGCYTSASECGGDWWHYFENEKAVWIWIADATGHGAPAALLTSAAKSAVSIIEQLNLPLKESFEHLNFAICNVSKENMMMTSFVGMIDKKTLDFHYVNASHEPSILIKKNASISKDDLIFLNDSTNPRLGQSKSSQFSSSSIKLDPGDRIIFYTDGVIDVRSPEDKQYGERSFMRGIVKSYNEASSLTDFYTQYETSLNAFRSNTELLDDVTYCFFEIK